MSYCNDSMVIYWFTSEKYLTSNINSSAFYKCSHAFLFTSLFVAKLAIHITIQKRAFISIHLLAKVLQVIQKRFQG